MEVNSILKGSQLLQRTRNSEVETSVREKRSVLEEVNKHQEKVAKEGSLSKDEVKKLVDVFNRFLDPMDSQLQFEFHEDLDEYYLTIVDFDTKEVIREIPPKKLLDVYAAMAEFMGLIVDEKI